MAKFEQEAANFRAMIDRCCVVCGGITHAKFYELHCGISRQYGHQLEKGHTNPLSTLVKICDRLGLSVDDARNGEVVFIRDRTPQEYRTEISGLRSEISKLGVKVSDLKRERDAWAMLAEQDNSKLKAAERRISNLESALKSANEKLDSINALSSERIEAKSVAFMRACS